jgi:hypothetical protein
MIRTTRTAWLLAVILTTTVHAQSPVRGGPWPISDAPPELRATIARADLVITSMQDTLLRELNAALTRGGPAGALQSCHVDVIGLTQRVARQEGVAAGRTSDRLRSPTNAPRPWAAPLVKAHAGKLAHEVEGFAADLGDTVGVLRPIAHRPLCGSCHGPADQVSAAVHQALKERYPADRAIGFAEGEIRGWFWVEFPKPSR